MSSMNQLICPNCNAKIEADSIQLFVYCRYCGTKIKTRDIVEVRYVQEAESLEKMVADGDTYLKVEEYYLAEQKFREVIKQYPDRCEGYDGLIRALTKDGTVFPLMHETEAFGLLYESERLASEEEKAAYAEKRAKLAEAFDAERELVEVRLRDKEDNLPKQRAYDLAVYAFWIWFAFCIIAALCFIAGLIEASIGFVILMGLMAFVLRILRNRIRNL